jgi:hypothetical protein
LKDVFSATADGVAQWFKNAGYTAEQTAQVLKDIFSVGETAAAQILKDVGFTFWDIVSSLENTFLIAFEMAFAIVTIIFG